jgi:methyltransferase family protein
VSCTQCRGIEAQFDGRTAARDLKRYRRKGPDRTTRILIAALEREGVAGMTLLDIGGGVGAISHALLDAGVARVVHVDAAPPYLAAAQGEATRLGHAASIDFRAGDFTTLAADIAPADIVTLDRVICCYDDMPALVGASAARARRYYGAVYPRDVWWVRAGLAVANLLLKLRGSLFRTYAHPTAAVDAEVAKQGLTRRFTRVTFIWQVVVYAR